MYFWKIYARFTNTLLTNPVCPAEDVITSVAPKDDIVTNQQVVLTLNPDDFVTQTILGNDAARVAITTDSCSNPEGRYVFASLWVSASLAERPTSPS